MVAQVEIGGREWRIERLMTEDKWWMNLVKRLASFRPVSYVLARILRPIDLWFYKRSEGRTTLTNRLTGLETICLDTIGARTGKIRPVFLAAARTGEKWVIAASNFGNQNHPGWYYNLIRYPEVELTNKGEIRRYRARLTEGAEREHCWSKLVGMYRGFADYRIRAGDRVIPVFMLEPTDSTK
jgi:deazaflavin-dependent oxidoreductase (nitroreductase family)